MFIRWILKIKIIPDTMFHLFSVSYSVLWFIFNLLWMESQGNWKQPTNKCVSVQCESIVSAWLRSAKLS